MEDAQIIELYWQREEAAIAETSEKYGAFLLSVAWNVLHVHHDAEECVNDTYLRAWNAIPPYPPHRPAHLAGLHRPEPEPGPLEAAAGGKAER